MEQHLAIHTQRQQRAHNNNSYTTKNTIHYNLPTVNLLEVSTNQNMFDIDGNDSVNSCLADYSLTVSDDSLDFYKQAISKQLDQARYRPQLHRFLRMAFRQAIGQLVELDPAMVEGRIFPKQGNRACFNYMTQFLRRTVLKLVWLCLPPNGKDRDIIARLPGLHKLDNPGNAYMEIYKRIFNSLLLLGSADVALWFFFQVPNYQNYNIDGYRQVYAVMIDYALKHWPQEAIYNLSRVDIIENPRLRYEIATRATTFYYNLAYHNQSNAELIHSLCKLQRHIYPELEYVSSHCQLDRNWRRNPALPLRPIKYVANQADPELLRMLDLFDKERGPEAITGTGVQAFIDRGMRLRMEDGKMEKIRKMRICFISDKLMGYTSVFRDRIGLIYGLDPRYFEVWVAVWSPLDKIDRSSITKYFLDNIHKAGRLIRLHKQDLKYCQGEIARHKFDIVFYPDLGMLQDATLMAHSRLAPVQLTTWGHSDTSGNPSIDYYITSQLFEQTGDLAIPRSNYSEAPVLMQSSGTYYYSPRYMADQHFKRSFEEFFMTKKQLGFPEDAIVVGCLHSFYKFNIEFEKVLSQIINRANREIQRPVYLALSNSISFNKEHLARLNKIMGVQCISRIKWFQNKPPNEWLNLVSICDIMLDPFPFGGCNTTLEAFDYGKPVVCWPSNMMISGRFTLGFYKQMGMEKVGCCVDNDKEYVDMAIKLMKDREYYNFVSKNISERKDRLFEASEVIREYEQLFNKLVRMHLPGGI